MNLQSTNLGNWTANEVVSNTKQISDYVEGRIREQADYTAFEVFPTTETILAGTESDVLIPESMKSRFPNETYYRYTVDVPENDSITLTFFSNNRLEDQNTVIDWGDGTTFDVKNDIDPENYKFYPEDGYWAFKVSHTYIDETLLNTKFILKVFGNTYVKCSNSGDNGIISRAFSADLPVANCLKNVSSLFFNNLRVLAIDIPMYYNIKNVSNWSVFCTGAKNLRYFNCSEHTFVNKIAAINQAFECCENLECDINNFTPLFKDFNSESTFSLLFEYCSKLYGTIDPYVYWKNPGLKYVDKNRINSNLSHSDHYHQNQKFAPFSYSSLEPQCPKNWCVSTKLIDGKWIEDPDHDWSICLPDYNSKQEPIEFNTDLVSEITQEVSKNIKQLVKRVGSLILTSDEGNIQVDIHAYDDFGTSFTLTKKTPQTGSGVYELSDKAIELGVTKTNLKHIKIGNTFTSIEKYACNIGDDTFLANMTSLEIPSNVISIGDNAFGKCVNLRSLVFNEGLQTIGNTAFVSIRCNSVIFPSTLTKIDGYSLGTPGTELISVTFKSLPEFPTNAPISNMNNSTIEINFPNNTMEDVKEKAGYNEDTHEVVNKWFRGSFIIDRTVNCSNGSFTIKS